MGASFCNVRMVSVVGGRDAEQQAFTLRQGAEIVFATPGRLCDSLDKRHTVLNQCNYIVIDEADKMVDLGFEDYVRRVLLAIPGSNMKSEFPQVSLHYHRWRPGPSEEGHRTEARIQRRGEEKEETRGVARRRRTTDHRFRQSEEGRGCAGEVFGQQWLSCVLDSRWQEPGATRMGHELLQGRQVRYSRGHGCGWQRFGYRGRHAGYQFRHAQDDRGLHAPYWPNGSCWQQGSGHLDGYARGLRDLLRPHPVPQVLQPDCAPRVGLASGVEVQARHAQRTRPGDGHQDQGSHRVRQEVSAWLLRARECSSACAVCRIARAALQ